MPKKTVLFLASWYPNRGSLFLGHFVQRHAEAACEIADVKVLFATSSEDARDFEMERNTVNGVDTLVVYYPKVKLPIPGVKQLISRKRYLRALKIGFSVLDTHFDLVHLNEAFPAGIFARFLKRKHRINYILTVHWTGYLNHTRTFKKLPAPTKAIHRQIFAGASEIIPVSDHLGKSLVSLGLANKYKVIPNVVNEKIFYPASAKDASASPRFLHVSSFDDDHKNIRGMFSAFKNLQNSGVDFFLHFIVEYNKSEVWDRIDEYGLDRKKCEVDEKAPPQTVAEAMRKADCLVLFSNYETFSVVIAEAWVSGIPAIYSRCGGLTEIADSTLGVQVPKRDVDALTGALKNFKASDYDSRTISAKSRSFTTGEVARSFAGLYDAHSVKT